MTVSKLQKAAEIEDLLRENGYNATVMDVTVENARMSAGNHARVGAYTLKVRLDV